MCCFIGNVISNGTVMAIVIGIFVVVNIFVVAIATTMIKIIMLTLSMPHFMLLLLIAYNFAVFVSVSTVLLIHCQASRTIATITVSTMMIDRICIHLSFVHIIMTAPSL